MTIATQRKTRHDRGAEKQSAQPDYPYTMKLPDGRTVYVEVPGCWVTRDRGGKIAFMPQAVRLLDRVRALAVRLDRPPSPGYITALREALGLTQKELAERMGVNKMSVSRWERGVSRPSVESLLGLEKLRRKAARKGVALSG